MQVWAKRKKKNMYNTEYQAIERESCADLWAESFLDTSGAEAQFD
jgi:hypothetical protein